MEHILFSAHLHPFRTSFACSPYDIANTSYELRKGIGALGRVRTEQPVQKHAGTSVSQSLYETLPGASVCHTQGGYQRCGITALHDVMDPTPSIAATKYINGSILEKDPTDRWILQLFPAFGQRDFVSIP